MPHSSEMQNANIHGHFQPEIPENPRQSDTLQNDVADAADVAESASEAPTPTVPTEPADAKKIRYRAKPKFPLPVAAKVLLIDLDGTLLDTAADIAAAANRMRAAFGFPPLEPAVIRNFIGRGIPHLVSQP